MTYRRLWTWQANHRLSQEAFLLSSPFVGTLTGPIWPLTSPLLPSSHLPPQMDVKKMCFSFSLGRAALSSSLTLLVSNQNPPPSSHTKVQILTHPDHSYPQRYSHLMWNQRICHKREILFSLLHHRVNKKTKKPWSEKWSFTGSPW